MKQIRFSITSTGVIDELIGEVCHKILKTFYAFYLCHSAHSRFVGSFVGRTCMDLSYQRLAPFLSWPPPCSMSNALLESVGWTPVGSSRHSTHTHRSISSRDSRFTGSVNHTLICECVCVCVCIKVIKHNKESFSFHLSLYSFAEL